MSTDALPRPIYTAPCPPWCRGAHSDADRQQDGRMHEVLVAVSTPHPGVMNAGCAEVALYAQTDEHPGDVGPVCVRVDGLAEMNPAGARRLALEIPRAADLAEGVIS